MRVRRRAHPALLILIALVVAAAAGCGADQPAPRAAGAGTSDTVRGTVTVLAAASLTESFTKIGKDFEAANPGVKVVLSFGASSALAQQVNSGAPADVFASASPTNINQVTGDGEPVVFARNQLVIAVPKGDPRNLRTLADLARPGVKVALCAEQVPCGAAARKALETGGVKLTPVTLEQDVKATLTKLRLGEVDAALVYRTDAAAAAQQVDGVEFPESASAVNDYPIVALAKAPNPAGARAFVAYVRSESALSVLAAAGFQRP
jgi:molybdate transport system substrate-binding protein